MSAPTAKPAIKGSPMAKTPAPIIKTLSTADHVVAVCARAEMASPIADLLSFETLDFIPSLTLERQETVRAPLLTVISEAYFCRTGSRKVIGHNLTRTVSDD